MFIPPSLLHSLTYAPSPLILPPAIRISKLSCVRLIGVLGRGVVVGGGGVVGGGFSLQRTPAASVDSQSCTPSIVQVSPGLGQVLLDGPTS